MKANTRYGKFFATCLLTTISCFGIQLVAENDYFFAKGLLREDFNVMEACFRENPNIARTPEPVVGTMPLAYIGPALHAVELAQWLVAHGADVNEAGSDGLTPLQGSCDSPEVIRFLLDNGAIVSRTMLRLAERFARQGNPTQIIIAPMLREAYDRQQANQQAASPAAQQAPRPTNQVLPAVELAAGQITGGAINRTRPTPPPPSGWLRGIVAASATMASF